MWINNQNNKNGGYPIGKFEFPIPNHFLRNQFCISKVEPKFSNLDFAASPHVLR
jgi:hypothetical protein